MPSCTGNDNNIKYSNGVLRRPLDTLLTYRAKIVQIISITLGRYKDTRSIQPELGQYDSINTDYVISGADGNDVMDIGPNRIGRI